MKPTLILLATWLLIAPLNAANFVVDCRDRSPELLLTRNGCLGPVADIVERLLTRLGHRVEWQHNHWNDTIQAAESGDIDLVIRHSMNDHRQTFLHEVAYGYEIRLIYYYLAAHIDKPVNTIDDLSGLTVGAKEGSFYSPEFEKNTRITKKLYPETTDIALALEAGEIDVAITSDAHGLDRFQVIMGVRPAVYTEKFYNGRFISIPKRSKRARYFRDVEKTLHTMIKNGEITEIFEQYGLAPPFQLAD